MSIRMLLGRLCNEEEEELGWVIGGCYKGEGGLGGWVMNEREVWIGN